jgi:hypothetical protein
VASHLGVRTQTYQPAENQEWLGSASGTQNADPITLDAAAFAATHPSGIIPSGTPLKRAGSGKYQPILAADTKATVAGHLFTTVDLTAGGTQAAADSIAALFWGPGEVVIAKLTAGVGTGPSVAFAVNETVGLIRYV